MLTHPVIDKIAEAQRARYLELLQAPPAPVLETRVWTDLDEIPDSEDSACRCWLDFVERCVVVAPDCDVHGHFAWGESR